MCGDTMQLVCHCHAYLQPCIVADRSCAGAALLWFVACMLRCGGCLWLPCMHVLPRGHTHQITCCVRTVQFHFISTLQVVWLDH